MAITKCIIELSSSLCFLGNILFLLAHLSRRLTVELIGQVGLRRPSSTLLNIFSSETTVPIKVKFHMDPPRDKETKVCSKGPAHMTKLAAMPIYGITFKKISFSGTKWPMTLNVGMQHWVLKHYQISSNDDPELTLTYFMARSNLVPYAIVWEKSITMDFFRNYCRL